MTTKPTTNDFFTKDLSQAYDERNKKLNAISDNMHFLIRLVLKDLPKQARILCVGVGTGAEIFSLAQEFPEWKFVGLDPSASMLEVCQERVNSAGISDRCELIHGYIQDLKTDQKFDAVLSVLVAHFIKVPERTSYFQNIHQHLKSGGYFVNTEISYDLDSAEFSSMLKNWEKVQTLMGATPEKLETLPQQLREMLTVIPPRSTEELLRENGFPLPIRFLQSFMITGWYSQKP